MIVSHHTAQALLRHDDPVIHTAESPSQYCSRLPTRGRGCTNQRINRCRHLLSLIERFCKLSCDARPSGRGPTFVSGNLKTRIRAITARHSLFPESKTRTAIGAPHGTLSPKGAIRGCHVPLEKYNPAPQAALRTSASAARQCAPIALARIDALGHVHARASSATCRPGRSAPGPQPHGGLPMRAPICDCDRSLGLVPPVFRARPVSDVARS